MDWYYAKHGRQEGPVGEAELRSMLASGALSGSDLVWREGMAEWQPAESAGELSAAASAGSSSPAMAVPVSSSAASPYQTPQAPLQAPAMAAVVPTSGLAIASLVCGILGLVVTMGCLLGAITGVPAVICGHAALHNIRNSAIPVQGRGMAIAGLVTGYLASLGTLVLVLLFVFAMAGGAADGAP